MAAQRQRLAGFRGWGAAVHGNRARSANDSPDRRPCREVAFSGCCALESIRIRRAILGVELCAGISPGAPCRHCRASRVQRRMDGVRCRIRVFLSIRRIAFRSHAGSRRNGDRLDCLGTRGIKPCRQSPVGAACSAAPSRDFRKASARANLRKHKRSRQNDAALCIRFLRQWFRRAAFNSPATPGWSSRVPHPLASHARNNTICPAADSRQ